MIKSIWNLIKKIAAYVVGKGNDVYEKHADPKVVIRQAIRELEEERTSSINSYAEVVKDVRSMQSQLKTYEGKLNTLAQEAKEAKTNGDMDLARRKGKLALQFKDTVEGCKKTISLLDKSQEQIKDRVDRIADEVANLKSQESLLKAAQTMESYSTKNLKRNIPGATDSGVDVAKLIEESRNRVNEAQHNVEAWNETNDVFASHAQEHVDTEVDEWLDQLDK